MVWEIFQLSRLQNMLKFNLFTVMGEKPACLAVQTFAKVPEQQEVRVLSHTLQKSLQKETK